MLASRSAGVVSKAGFMPDICQMDAAFRSLPGQGGNWCAPTAFANALIALDYLGFDGLVRGDPQSKAAQLALLGELGAPQYFGTGTAGTQPLRAMTGITQFVRSRGYDVNVEWKGWRSAGSFSQGHVIDETWLQQGVEGASGVVLNIGWYQRVGASYHRIAGHYLTLAGYQKEPQGTLYYVEDPAPRSGLGKVVHLARLASIPNGTLAAWNRYPARDARPHFFLEGVVLKPGADAAILDGAIRFAVSRRQPIMIAEERSAVSRQRTAISR